MPSKEVHVASAETGSSRPLWVLDSVSLTPEQTNALGIIEGENFSFLKERVLKDDSIPEVFVDEAIEEYKKFLGMHAHDVKAFLTMRDGSYIDEVWHAHILFTRSYADFCGRVFGHFFHHDPFSKSTPDKDPQGSWKKFKDGYEALYGEINHLWTIHAPSEE
jgi:hypothetical protein